MEQSYVEKRPSKSSRKGGEDVRAEGRRGGRSRRKKELLKLEGHLPKHRSFLREEEESKSAFTSRKNGASRYRRGGETDLQLLAHELEQRPWILSNGFPGVGQTRSEVSSVAQRRDSSRISQPSRLLDLGGKSSRRGRRKARVDLPSASSSLP